MMTADPPKSRRSRTNIPSLVCAFLASLTTGGISYAFGLYGDALKKTLELTQGQLDTISTAFFFAGLFSWIPGLCADKFGTRFALSVGGVATGASTIAFWMVARQFIFIPHSLIVMTLSILGIAIFLSSALITGSVFKIIVASCGPGTKGSAVGVAKGYVGLGSGVYASLFEAIRVPGETDLDFLPMAAFFAVACATLPALALLPSKAEVERTTLVDEATPLHFRTLFGSLICMGFLIIVNSLSELVKSDEAVSSAQQRGGPNYAMSLFLVGIWLAPIISLLYLPRKRQNQSSVIVMQEVSQVDVDEEDDDEEEVIVLPDDDDELSIGENDPLARSKTNQNSGNSGKDGADDEGQQLLVEDGEDEEEQLDDVRSPSESKDKNLLQMLRTPSALLMLWTTTILAGAGTVETNNMGQMVESLGFRPQVGSASLALFSVAQSGARVFTGALSEVALDWNTRSCCIDNGVPRPFFFVVASVMGFIAHLLLMVTTEQVSFVLGVTLSGFAFGMMWPLMVLIVGEVFGTAHVGANYMFYDGFTSAAGTLFLSKFIAGDVYEEHIDPSTNGGDAFTCIGTLCFRETHGIVALLSLTCIVTSCAMVYTSRHAYNSSRLHGS